MMTEHEFWGQFHELKKILVKKKKVTNNVWLKLSELKYVKSADNSFPTVKHAIFVQLLAKVGG